MADGGLCCGSAGIYNLTQPETARQLRERKLDHALATGADVIVTANPGCLLHLRAGLAERGSAVQVKHIVELLDEAGTASLPGPPAKTGPHPPSHSPNPGRGGEDRSSPGVEGIPHGHAAHASR